MKLPLLACLLALTTPLCAQEITPDAPKEFGFNFSYSFSEKTRVTSVEIGFQREIPGAKAVPFDQTVTGKKGLLTRETLSFLSASGEVLGTLNTFFDATGKLESQKLTEKDQPERALSWFKTAAKSPSLSVTGSALQARYTLQNGRLRERILNLQTSKGTREFKTQYDELGRRESDVCESANGPLSVRYFYNEEGMSRFSTDATAKEKAKEILLTRTANGQLSQITIKEGGILMSRMMPIFDDKGINSQMRMETYEDGLLSSAFTMNTASKNATQEDYDAGVLTSRKTFTVSENSEQKLQSVEEFEMGHLQKRTQYDENGAVSNISTFNADGSAKTTQTFKNGVEVGAEK